jgi:hypothetical protein
MLGVIIMYVIKANAIMLIVITPLIVQLIPKVTRLKQLIPVTDVKTKSAGAFALCKLFHLGAI